MSFELRCENVQVRNALGLGFRKVRHQKHRIHQKHHIQVRNALGLGFRNGKGLHWVFVTDIKGAFIGRDDLVMRSVVCSLR